MKLIKILLAIFVALIVLSVVAVAVLGALGEEMPERRAKMERSALVDERAV